MNRVDPARMRSRVRSVTAGVIAVALLGAGGVAAGTAATRQADNGGNSARSKSGDIDLNLPRSPDVTNNVQPSDPGGNPGITSGGGAGDSVSQGS
jgi:hypothetical protein